MAAIALEDVYYRYPGASEWALKGVTLDIPRGRVLVAGGTGSGKTTLLRVASGAAPRVYGGLLRGRVEASGRVVLVPQNFDAFILMPTARLELLYVMENLGIPRSEAEARLETISGTLGIARILDEPIHRLSAGERQRIAVASALAASPKVLLLDEPLAYVDPQSVDKLLSGIEEAGVESVVVAEHRLRPLRRWATHLIYLEEGTVAYAGPPSGATGIPLQLRIQLMDPGEAASVLEASGCLG